MAEENQTSTENNHALVKKEKPIIAATARGVQFNDLDSMYRFCVAVVNSRQFKDLDSPESALIRLQAGLELGLSPIWSLVNIMVVNGRPSLWGDALHGLILRQPDCLDVKEYSENSGDQLVAVCEVHRRNRVPVVRRYSVSDAKRARLWDKSGPWQTNPTRMLQMRARSFAERDSYSDILRGLGVIEEMRDIEPSEPVKSMKQPDIVLPDEVEGAVARENNIENRG